MTQPSASLDDLRDQIEERVLVQQRTQDEVYDWLVSIGVQTSLRTLQRRCQEWNTTRRGTVPRQLIDAIHTQYETTTDSDSQIAAHVTSQGLSTTARQVKRIRLAHGWRRRAANTSQLTLQRDRTYVLVRQALLEEGIIRSYGREFMTTYLRVQHRHRARERDVADALAELDPTGNSGRRPGVERQHRHEFIIPGPDWIWSIDGHDKFRNYGIEIYAAIDGYSRRIIWIYISNSNRTQVSVAR